MLLILGFRTCKCYLIIPEKENKIDNEFADLQTNNNVIKSILVAVGVILVFGLVFFISLKQDEKLNKEKNETKFHEISVDQYNELLCWYKKMKKLSPYTYTHIQALSFYCPREGRNSYLTLPGSIKKSFIGDKTI